MIDRATVDRIMAATNIVDVVGEFVTLRKAGTNYKGLCPFHDDKTPSFMVSPARQICKCFACGEGGNAVNFLMKHEQITYPEALRWLAKKYNIEIEERELTDDERREQSERESMFIVNEWASQYFHDVLKNNVDGQAIGKQYFRSRGIRDDIIEKFRLGFALTKRDAMAQEARRKGFKDEFLLKTGLCYQPNQSSTTQPPTPITQLVDRFAGRAIFPWLNVSGKVVAFGGRKLDAATKGVQQKYVNSPDSEIYHKERELYGIFQAKKAIVKEDCVYMVEGYTDVIAMHQCGVENVVANSGTALSVHQIKLLHRFTQNIVLLYDGDEAGIHAAMRGTDMLLSEGMNIKVLLLPDGDDPDSFSRKHTAQQLKEYIEQHQTDFIEFKTNLLLKDVKDPIKRAEAVNSIVRSVSVIPDQMVREAYIKDCVHRLGINERTLVTQVNKFVAEKGREDMRDNAATPDAGSGDNASPAPAVQTAPAGIGLSSTKGRNIEQMLMKTVIKYGDVVIYDDVEDEDGNHFSMNIAQFVAYDFGNDGLTFAEPVYNRMLQEAVEHSADKDFKTEEYFLKHHDPEVSQMAVELAVERHQLSRIFVKEPTRDNLRTTVEHLLIDYRGDILNQRIEELNRQMKNAGNDMELLKPIYEEFEKARQMRNTLVQKVGRDING